MTDQPLSQVLVWEKKQVQIEDDQDAVHAMQASRVDNGPKPSQTFESHCKNVKNRTLTTQ